MATETGLPVEQRIIRLLQHLGIQQAHFAARTPLDWTGLASNYPGVFSSFTLLGPTGFEPHTIGNLAARLLVVNGDRGPTATRVKQALDGQPDAKLATLGDYPILGWSDLAADRTDEIASAMLDFLGRHTPQGGDARVAPAEEQGEVAGISYHIRGSGPPLVLLPMLLSPSQWEPLIPKLNQHYRTITLGGVELGAVAMLESRGRSDGYVRMVRNLIEETRLRPGEAVLDVGCGTGVVDRWLAHHTGGQNRITGVDINRYLLQEAAALARKEGLAEQIDFRDGSADALPFPDNSFDVAMSVTVIEETNADRMLAEMVRVTRPGGRVAVIARAVDVLPLMNVPLPPEVKAKIEAPGVLGNVSEGGCGDVSLYRRFLQAGLTQVKMLPQIPAFDSSSPTFIRFMQDMVAYRLNPEDARQWQAGLAQAEAEGTLFMTWPHHCAVGTRPG